MGQLVLFRTDELTYSDGSFEYAISMKCPWQYVRAHLTTFVAEGSPEEVTQHLHRLT